MATRGLEQLVITERGRLLTKNDGVEVDATPLGSPIIIITKSQIYIDGQKLEEAARQMQKLAGVRDMPNAYIIGTAEGESIDAQGILIEGSLEGRPLLGRVGIPSYMVPIQFYKITRMSPIIG